MIDQKQIVCNRIRTPDGTILQSHHRHDYVNYTDKNGLEYVVDGGTSYLRRNVREDAPYEEMSLTAEDSFELIRKAVCWGTRGKNGDRRLEWVPISKLEVDHIYSILETQTHAAKWLLELMEQELEYRIECGD